MKSNIELKFLTPNELANAKDLDWRYEHVSDDNFGFADPKKNRIYVRAGLDADLTKYLINHELEHLFELEGTHEDEHGIRHKGGFWKVALPIIIGVAGTALGGWGLPALGAMAGMGGLGGSLGGALATGVGAGLGSFGGNTLGQVTTGQKPDWVGNAIGAAGAGVTAGAGSYLNAFRPMSVGGKIGSTGGKGFSGWITGPADTGSAWGNLGNAVAMSPGLSSLVTGGLKTGTQTGLGLLTRPSGSMGMFQPNAMGPTGGGKVPLPRSPFGYGQEGAMGGDKGTGGRGGMDLPGGKGLQQAGITMGAANTLPDGAQGSEAGQQSYNPLKSIGFQRGAQRF